MSTLYRKYRPKTFSEIQGQVHVVRTLTRAISNNRIGHAYLLTGPRGTGKTTIARIFSKTVNCLDTQEPSKNDQTLVVAIEPCNKCKNCKMVLSEKALDIVEIDAASHTGVDNIRRLKETIILPPTAFEYKVYIIDEVHMLSIGAFNALLKTLEEPPAHAIFILATTELHKVPETIISRCQRFDISHLSGQQIVQRLEQIAKSEKIEIDKEALETIALEAEGGMRDAESLLGQIISLEDKNITANEVNDILGTSSKRITEQFSRLLVQNETKRALEELDKIQQEGINLKNFNKNLLSYFRGLMIIRTSPKAAQKILSSFSKQQFESAKTIAQGVSIENVVLLIELLQKSLNMLKNVTIPQLPLELAIIEFSLKTSSPEKNDVPEQAPEEKTEKKQPLEKIQKIKPAKEPEISEAFENPSDDQEDKAPVPTKKTAKEPKKVEPLEKPAGPSGKTSATLEEVLDRWAKIIEGVKPHNHSIHAFLENCSPVGIKSGTLYVKTKYDFYKEKLSETENRLTVQNVIAKVTNSSLKLAFITENELSQMNFPKEKAAKKGNALHSAMKVFGGKITKK